MGLSLIRLVGESRRHFHTLVGNPLQLSVIRLQKAPIFVITSVAAAAAGGRWCGGVGWENAGAGSAVAAGPVHSNSLYDDRRRAWRHVESVIRVSGPELLTGRRQLGHSPWDKLRRAAAETHFRCRCVRIFYDIW